MFRSLSNLGPVTDTGSSVSWEKTAREQVASKPIPRTVDGLMLCWFSARWTDEQIHRQMSFVDCSYRILNVLTLVFRASLDLLLATKPG